MRYSGTESPILSIHGHIAALVLILDELSDILSHHKILVVSVLGSVLADTLGKGCVLLVKGSEQSLSYATLSQRLPQPLETQNKSIILLFLAFLGVIF